MNDLNQARLLIVDDQEVNVLLLEQMLAQQGYTNVVSTTVSSETVALFEQDPPDLLLLDLQMPHPDGFEVMELVRRWTTSETYVPVLVLTADASHETRLRALEAGARDFVSKPFEFVEVSLRIRNLLQTRKLQLELQSLNESLEARVQARTHELEQARTEAFERLALAAEFRDDDTREHTKRVGMSAGMLAAEIGLGPTVVDAIERIAPLHDIGKIGIPDAILLKPGNLTSDEFAIIKTHTAIGRGILSGSRSPLLQMGAEIALTHHERWDGSGYPAGLGGAQIPITGRIVALADAFDAMTHSRPYKDAMPIADAVAEVERSAGSHFDPDVVAAFHRLDPERLAQPAASHQRPPVTSDAWHMLEEITGITNESSEHLTDAVLEATFANTDAGALIADDDRRLVSANAAACSMLGFDLEELHARRIDDIMPLPVRPELDAMWSSFLAEGVRTSAFEFLRADGTTFVTTYRGIAHLLPGRHLALLSPEAESPGSADESTTSPT